MNIKLIRLVTGEFIMADVEANNGDTLALRDPVILMIGKEQVGFAAFNPFGAEDTVVMNAIHVLYEVTPQDDLVAEYTRVFSRIQIAPANTLQ